MEEPKQGRDRDAALNRRNFYIDGVSRPPSRDSQYSRSKIPRPQVRPTANISDFNSPNLAKQQDISLPTQPQLMDRPSQSTTPDQSLLNMSLPKDIARHRHKPATKRKSRGRRIVKYSLLSLAVILIGGGIYYGSSIISNVNKVFHGNVFSDVHAIFSGSKLKESNGRINILLAGDSVDDPGHQGAILTDSIMVISFNPTTKSGFILSIPRDLWVDIPSWGHQKINAANAVINFSQPGYPSGGIGQLQQIVQTDLGIPIDYEATIDYTAFRDAVNAVGGITIDIQSPDPRGLYDPYTHLKLPNGEVTLTGQQALDLARSRGDGPGAYGFPTADFTRTQHQRQMLVALFKKSLSIGVLSNPVKVANLFNSFGNNVTTNLTLGDVTSLIHATGGISLANLQSVSYAYGGTNALLQSYLAPDGEDALIPTLGIDNFTNIQAFYQQLTSSNPITQEAPTVTILNASDVTGLASREKTVLEAQGFNVLDVSDASTVYPKSLIIDNSSAAKPASLTKLKNDIKGQVTSSVSSSNEASEAANYSTDFVVVLGQDWDNTPATGNPIQN